ncbi:MAG TPA: CBS domain-containing protein [Falsiroseomonas sp.]|jgi:CBS domain-containing protein|nr:CBS domain-containing protein [Falsiroseomonas sp.]
MMAGDLMTQEVVTVPPDMSVRAIARVLSEARISAVPVTDEAHRLLGIVAELDLLRRLAEVDKPRPGWIASIFTDDRVLADRYARAHGLKAYDVMTREVVSVTEDTPVEAVARLIEERGLRSVPVTASDRTLRGIVSRADLIRALLTPAGCDAQVADDELRRDILQALRRQPWADVNYLTIEVETGAARIGGFHASPEVQRAVRVLVEGVAGVRTVQDNSRPLPMRYGFSGV